MASISNEFKFPGDVTRDVVLSSLNHGFNRTAGTVSSVKSLQQYIYDNPASFEEMTVLEDKTACGVTDKELAKPTKRDIKVDYFRLGAKRCNIELIYDEDGDYTDFTNRNGSGMAALSQYSGRDVKVLEFMKRGMAVDNFRRLWFSDAGNTGSFYDTPMNGLMTEILDNSSTTAGSDNCFQAGDLDSGLTEAVVISSLKELYEGSYINLRMMLPSEKVFEVTPNVYYVFLSYLENITGSDKNFDFIQKPDGTLYYRGIEIRMIGEWEQALAGTGTLALDLATDTQALIVYTLKRNLWGVTDKESDKTYLKTFYDEKDEQYYYRGRFALGTYIQEYGMTSFAKQNLV